jgi:hypothetical protein
MCTAPSFTMTVGLLYINLSFLLLSFICFHFFLSFFLSFSFQLVKQFMAQIRTTVESGFEPRSVSPMNQMIIWHHIELSDAALMNCILLRHFESNSNRILNS